MFDSMIGDLRAQVLTPLCCILHRIQIDDLPALLLRHHQNVVAWICAGAGMWMVCARYELACDPSSAVRQIKKGNEFEV